MKAVTQRVELATGVGTEIKFWRHDRSAAPAILLLPALGIPAGAYRRVAEALHRGGCHVLAIDLRGVGSSSVRASSKVDWGYAEMVDGELEALLGYAREQLPQSSLHWFCHSMGGHLAVIHSIQRCCAGRPTIDGLILVASGSPQLDMLAPRVRGQARFLLWMVRAMLAVMGVFRGDWVGFGGRQSATLMREWAGFVRRGEMPVGDARLGAAQPIDTRVLGLAMQGDDYAPAEAVTALLQRLVSAPQVETINAATGQTEPGHSAWLKSPPQQLIDRVVAFATAQN